MTSYRRMEDAELRLDAIEKSLIIRDTTNIRDQFAIAIMTGLLSSRIDSIQASTIEFFGKVSYEGADILLKIRENHETNS